MNQELLNQAYNKQMIHDQLCACIDFHVTEPSLKELSLEAINYKISEFMFSKLTFAHFCVWEKDGKLDDLIKIMASVELFVLSCDILDDLQDQDTTSVPWMKVEPKFSMNLVYLFLSLSKTLLQETSYSAEKKSLMVQTLVRHEINSLMGQHQDLKQAMMSEEEYLEMIKMKSGSFVSLSCLIASVNATKEQQAIIKEYGEFIGCTAQIENDLLGIKEKHRFKDIVNRAITLPIIYLFHTRPTSLMSMFDYYERKIESETFEKNLPSIMEYIQESGTFEYSRTMQLIQMQRALSLVDELYTDENDRNLIRNAFFKRI